MLLLDYEFWLPHQYNEMLFVDPFLQPLILSIYYHCMVNFKLLLFSYLTIWWVIPTFDNKIICYAITTIRHVTVICQGSASYRKKFPVSKALSSLQIMTESFWMLLLQSYILANAWGAYPTVPIGGIINIGKYFQLVQYVPKYKGKYKYPLCLSLWYCN